MNQTIALQNHAPPDISSLLTVEKLRTGCASCSMRELCLPVGLGLEDMAKLDTIIRKRRRVSKGHLLFRAGDPFVSLYAIRLGHFKTYQVQRDGSQQITGFLMTGEMLGMDAISTEVHQCDAMALEDSEVCEIPFVQLEQLFAEMPSLLRQFHRMMSHEITREQNVMLLLGSMPADQRFAAFLINLSSRYAARGFSPQIFQLRMGREEIGNYLSLTIESISRLLSKFKKHGILKVANRTIEIADLRRLRNIAAGNDTI
ncbi:MAG: fumarate/nitrate reduction transcriptional regulator Fnr [Burkholderiaceae bacterium]